VLPLMIFCSTCYLNSLLQYFFTVRQLRDVILQFDQFQEDDPTDKDPKHKRVGGRHVSSREVSRSKLCTFVKLRVRLLPSCLKSSTPWAVVSHLRLLYTQLIHAEVPAIYPERELAYLALVSSKDADEAARESGGGLGLSSTSTDATLVDEPAPLAQSPAEEPSATAAAVTASSRSLSKTSTSSSSVLGKRHFTESGDGHMDVDDASATRPPLAGRDLNRQDKSLDDGDTAAVSSSTPVCAQTMPIPDSEKEPPSRPRRRTVTQTLMQTESDVITTATGSESQENKGDNKAIVADVQSSEPSDNQKAGQPPPPLPPRRRPSETAPQSSYMMFGTRNF
jgi:ubiquitin carboxyl-terminal hydrolase 25/28